MESNPRVRREGSILLVENNNPAARNAFTPGYMDQIYEELVNAGAEVDVRVVVLAGVGEHFCAGGDLRALRERRSLPLEEREASLERLNRMVLAIRGCAKPVVAAVEGYAVGAGLALALACDLVVAARSAVFKASYVAVGLTPDGGTTASLAEIVPRQLANELCMTAEPVGAERLHALGAVNVLAQKGEALTDALALAERLACGPARALQRIKQLNAAAAGNSFEDQVRFEARTMAHSLGDAESAEGIAAFLEKRPAKFTQVA